jgi:hypothetical protein
MSFKAEELDEAAFQLWLERQPRCTSNARGTVEGDPLNLVIVGDHASIEECLGAWDETESLTLGTAWKTVKAFLLESQYRYSPVSPLYLGGRQQDLALQRARLSLNQRLHLRLWATSVRLDGQPVWIGQVSRDIGVRFTPRTWNLTTHLIDPDVDEARDYVLVCGSPVSPASASSLACRPRPPLPRAITSRAIPTLLTACERLQCSPPRGRPPRSCPGRLQQLRSEAWLALTLGLTGSASGSETEKLSCRLCR